jgi:hypothetical protein
VVEVVLVVGGADVVAGFEEVVDEPGSVVVVELSDGAADLFAESSKPEPVRRSARSTTKRIARKRQRTRKKENGELCICLSR